MSRTFSIYMNRFLYPCGERDVERLSGEVSSPCWAIHGARALSTSFVEQWGLCQVQLSFQTSSNHSNYSRLPYALFYSLCSPFNDGSRFGIVSVQYLSSRPRTGPKIILRLRRQLLLQQAANFQFGLWGPGLSSHTQVAIFTPKCKRSHSHRHKFAYGWCKFCLVCAATPWHPCSCLDFRPGKSAVVGVLGTVFALQNGHIGGICVAVILYAPSSPTCPICAGSHATNARRPHNFLSP